MIEQIYGPGSDTIAEVLKALSLRRDYLPRFHACRGATRALQMLLHSIQLRGSTRIARMLPFG